VTNEEFQLHVVDKLGRIETSQEFIARQVEEHDQQLEELVVEGEVTKRTGKRETRAYAGVTALVLAITEALRRGGV
jgi:hypothetical protein